MLLIYVCVFKLVNDVDVSLCVYINYGIQAAQECTGIVNFSNGEKNYPNSVSMF